MQINIAEIYPEILDRRAQLELILPGGTEAAELVFRDFTGAVVRAVSYGLPRGGVGMDLGRALDAHREAWTVFRQVWGLTGDIEQALAQVDAYLDQDPDARALGAEFYLYGWELERNKRLRTKPNDPAA